MLKINLSLDLTTTQKRCWQEDSNESISNRKGTADTALLCYCFLSDFRDVPEREGVVFSPFR